MNTIQKADTAGELVKREPSSFELLGAVLERGDITPEKVEIAEKLIRLRREEKKEADKKAFAKDFFQLKKEIATLELCADKEAKTRDGNSTMYVYCSEEELSSKLEPVLLRHGFVVLTDQKKDGDLVTVTISIIHEEGHCEDKHYTVRAGSTNAAKDGTMADTGGATSAWRHLMIKNFGLKSRIRETGDPRNFGGAITAEQAADLQRRVKETNSVEHAILQMAGIKVPAGEPVTLVHYKAMTSAKYEVIESMISMKERKGR